MESKKIYHFISHTHWDREWYMPFERFRYRLVNLIDRLLDLLDRDPQFHYFHLDGQTIVLEDYYALRPANRERLEAYIRQGRILVGPWYQQNDLFLTSGESTVRNLMTGISQSRQLGGEMKVGYLPDHFGLIGQMPQIFRQVGLDNCVFGRGYDLAHHRLPFFHWQAPDGSAVDSMLLYFWYNSAQRMPAGKEELSSVFTGMREREEAVNPSGHYAMMNGVDHMEAQYDLSDVLASLRVLVPEDVEVLHSTLPEYVQGVQDYMREQPAGYLETVEGELREAFEYSILAGTLSSRIYLKQANVHGHDLVEKWMEPLSVFCWMLELDPYESETIDYYWKLYMENHPHDSICGCSQDSVHDHMMDRFKRLEELADEVIERKKFVLARQIQGDGYELHDQKLVVFNTSQLPGKAVLRTPVYFLEEDGVAQFMIEDETGRSVPYRIVSESIRRKRVISPVNLPGVLRVKRFDIEWQPDAPALGYAAYRIRPNLPGAVIEDLADSPDSGEPPVLENAYLKVELAPDGSFHLHDKHTGQTFRNQGRIQDTGDGGDLYVFKNVEGDVPAVWDQPVIYTSHTKNRLYEECVYTFAWELPEGLDQDQTRRSTAKLPCDFRVTLRLDHDASHVQMKVEWNNRVKDHRLRLLFPGLGAADSVLAGGQFDAVRRQWDAGSQFQRDANSQPFWKWLAPVSGAYGCAVFAKGLHEYEITDEGRTAGITIHRGAETINMREAAVMEEDIQPKGQCLGSLAVELAIRPFHVKSVTATQLYQEAELFHQGLQTKLLAVDEQRWNQGRAWVQDTMHKGLFEEENPNAAKPFLPAIGTFLKLEGNVMASAIKWSADGAGPLLRVYNVEETSSPIELVSDAVRNEVNVTNLLEEVQGTISAKDSRLITEVAAKKIVTYQLRETGLD
ncbi:glycosyl hydrolase-related protein [Paenibacillus nasutitermitis]|uniref:Glycosyl hydrolase family 38 n=1 Tax=Paenibacillus nasutitermitis TaxID=1652958 RepID=A0A916Z5B5_9BACL|nr:glycosyl hydrolase-related protein [Paenibacillus nasutitermitis]GGD77494.1 glycosyl hydrolase family 38 [Paenibacillus nasutitermitis]